MGGVQAMRSMFTPVAVAVVLGLRLVSAMPAAQADSSLTDREIELLEARSALEVERAQNKKLQGRVEASESALAALQRNFAVVSSESEIFRRQVAALRLKIEALGNGGASGDNSAVEERLLKAVNELRIADEERKRLHEALLRLSEAVLTYQKVTVTSNADARLALEAEMRGAAKALGITAGEVAEAAPVAQSITDGMVISIKDDLALIVANLGTSHGVRVGMPFRVIRDNQTIATVRVVDAREKIAGAVIESLSSEKTKVQVGDRLMVEAVQ